MRSQDAVSSRLMGRTRTAAADGPTPDVGEPAGERLVVADGTLEGLKCLGLLFMTADHVNKYVLHGSMPALFAIGRLTLPLFAFVLAYNLARPAALAAADRVFRRTLARLVGAAAVASIPFAGLGGLAGGWWPLNILATFSVAVAAMYLTVQGGAWRKAAAAAVVVAGGGFVEYWWPAIGICLAAWCYCRRASARALIAWSASTLALCINGWAFGGTPMMNASLWAMAAFPIIWGATHVRINLPRSKWVFYFYYPAHLAVLWFIASAAKWHL